MANKKSAIKKLIKKKKVKKYKPFVTKDMMLMFNGNIDPASDDHRNAGDGAPLERFYSGGDG